MGLLSLAWPETFDVPVYTQPLRQIARMGLVFLTGGVFVLLSYAARTRWSGPLPVAFAMVGVLPMIGIALVSLVRAGPWPAPLVGIAFAAGVLADAVRPVTRPGGQRRRVPTIAIVTAVFCLVYGAMMLAAPQLIRAPRSSALAVQMARVGTVLLAAGVLLVLGWIVPRTRNATQVAAAVALLLLAAVFAPLRRLPAVVTYGVLGVALALEPLLHGWLQRRISQRSAECTIISDYELATETASWGFVLLVAVAGSTASTREARLALAILTMVASLFTFVWFHLLSVRGARLRRTVLGAAVYSGLVAVLVELTGGMESPYFLLYALPILALAWTRSPETILVPVVIPLASLVTETVLALRLALAPPGVALSMALPRAAGLLLVSGFAYLLARRNVDQQRRTHEASAKLEAVLAHMGDGLITTDRDGRITLCNSSALVLLGQNRDVRGERLVDIMPLQGADGSVLLAPRHPVRRALAGQPVPWDRFALTSTQSARPLAVTATPLLDISTEGGAIVLVRDVRTEVEIERMRDDFFSIASHELRTPLTVIKGNLEIALETAPEGPLKRTLDEALNSVMRLIRMANAFLDAARLEHGSLTLRLEDGYLADLVRQAVEMMRPDAEQKGLAIAYQARNGLPAVRMDMERVLQILLNLLSNSVRYTNSGQIDVWHDIKGGYVETLVSDSGIGIPPEHQGRLFTRFGQVERGLTRATGGSGLGLYISRRLAEQMGGMVTLKESVPGKGSTFALQLPAAGGANVLREEASPRDGRTGSR